MNERKKKKDGEKMGKKISDKKTVKPGNKPME